MKRLLRHMVTTLGDGGVSIRTLDTVGADLVLNPQFDGNVDNWTEGSSAGGVRTYNAPNLRTTNTSGTARARQTVTGIEVGARYLALAEQAKATSTIGGVANFGSSGPGTSEYLTETFSLTANALLAIKEFVATATSFYAQLASFSAGYSEWFYCSLRKLTATQFLDGTIFTDDFARADGYMGATPDNLPWLFTDPTNASQVIPKIVSGWVEMTKNAAGSSAGYPHLNFGDGIAKALFTDVKFDGSGAGLATISAKKSGGLLTVADILGDNPGSGSIHPVFTDTKFDIGIGIGGGAITPLTTINYAAPCATDGTEYRVGVALDGNTLRYVLPDGTAGTYTDSRFSGLAGPIAILEPYYVDPTVGTIAYRNASIQMGGRPDMELLAA